MSIIDDISFAQRDFLLRMGRDAEFAVIPATRIDELREAIDSVALFGHGPLDEGFFRLELMNGNVQVFGLAIYVGAKIGAGRYTP